MIRFFLVPVLNLALLISPVFSQNLAALQDSFLTLKYGAFLHFNMGTFTNEEWATPGQNPGRFNPTNLNCGQWADAAKAAGMRYMTLTSKHHDGFCLWNSAYTAYDVGSSSWRNGSGDVIREFVDSARSRGLKVCFYYSIWDKTSGSDTTFIKNQLAELLTNYGPITALWFDGWGWKIGYSAVPYNTIYNHVKSLQPECLVMENNHQHNLDKTDMVLYERNVDGIPPASNTLPVEVCCNIRADGSWFYHAAGNCNLKTVDYLYSSLHGINAAHGNYLLDLTPDTAGLIPQCQVSRLTEVAAMVPDTLMFNQDKATYYGTWLASSNRTFGDYFDDLKFTRTTNDSFIFTFNGTGVDFISEKNSDHGAFDIYLNGQFIQNVDLSAPAGTRLAQQVVFTASGLPMGTHRLKGIYKSNSTCYGVVDAFRVHPNTPSTSAGGNPLLQYVTLPCQNLVASPGSKLCVRMSHKTKELFFYSIHGRKIAKADAEADGTFKLPTLPAGLYLMKSKRSEWNALTVKVMVLR